MCWMQCTWNIHDVYRLCANPYVLQDVMHNAQPRQGKDGKMDDKTKGCVHIPEHDRG